MTREDMEIERYDRAKNKMNSCEGGLARHAVTSGKDEHRENI